MRKGYIAIVTAVVVSVAVLIIVAAVGLNSFLNRGDILTYNFKEVSRALSEACVETARLKLAESSTYAGNETIAVGSSSCRVVSVTASGSDRIISAEGIFKEAFTNLKVAVNASSLDVVSWEELRDF